MALLAPTLSSARNRSTVFQRRTVGAVCAIAAFGFAPASQAEGWYVSANAAYSDSSSEAWNDGANGAGNPRVDIESDTRFGIAFGKELLPGFKMELEYALGTYDTDTGRRSGSGLRAADSFAISADLDVDLLTLGASYEFRNATAFTPFVKVGLGSTFYDMDADLFVSSFAGNTFGGALPATFSYSGSGEDFAYYLGVGTGFELGEAFELTIEYRYADLGEVATDYDTNGDRIKTDLETNNVQVGLRYTF